MDFRREVSQYESHGGVLPLSGGLNRRLVSSREGVNMRGRGWVRDILSHFIILSLLGAGLFFLYKKAMSTPGLEDEHWVSTVFLAAFILLGMMVFIFAAFVCPRATVSCRRDGRMPGMTCVSFILTGDGFPSKAGLLTLCCTAGGEFPLLAVPRMSTASSSSTTPC